MIKWLLIAVGGLVLAEVIALFWLQGSIAGYKKFWLHHNLQVVSGQHVRYVALGDSTAQGIGATSPFRSYVGLTARALAQKYKQPVQTTNLSVSGARLQDLIDVQLPQLAKLKINKQTVVTVGIGANDVGNFNEAKFSQQMDTLMLNLPPQTVISDVPYFGGGRRRSLEPNVIKANVIIHRLARKHNLRVAPLHQATKAHHGIFYSSADLFHPSNIGYQNWFKAYWQVLNGS